MKQVQFFKIGFIVLIVLNLALVAFLMIGKPGGHRPSNANKGKEPFKQEAIAILNLNEEQQTKFFKLAQQHRESMEELENEQKKNLKPYFDKLLIAKNNIDQDSLLNRLQNLERQKIETTYLHFTEVKAILSESQIPQFEKFIKKAIHRILLDGKKPPHPPKDLQKPGV